MSKQYTATLVRGSTYYLRAERFDFNVSKTVSADDKAHLEESAVDVTSTKDGERIVRQKFSFKEIKKVEDDIFEDDEAEDEDDEAPVTKKVLTRKPSATRKR